MEVGFKNIDLGNSKEIENLAILTSNNRLALYIRGTYKDQAAVKCMELINKIAFQNVVENVNHREWWSGLITGDLNGSCPISKIWKTVRLFNSNQLLMELFIPKVIKFTQGVSGLLKINKTYTYLNEDGTAHILSQLGVNTSPIEDKQAGKMRKELAGDELEVGEMLEEIKSVTLSDPTSFRQHVLYPACLTYMQYFHTIVKKQQGFYILELGAKTGELAEQILKHMQNPVIDYQLIEPDAEMLQVAKKKLKDYEAKTKYHQQAIYQYHDKKISTINFKDVTCQQFDMIFAIDVLAKEAFYCRSDAREVFMAVEKVLRPGGHMFIAGEKPCWLRKEDFAMRKLTVKNSHLPSAKECFTHFYVLEKSQNSND